MKNFGLWNLIIIIAVAWLLNSYWRLDDEKTAWKNSRFLQHIVIQRLGKFFRNPVINFLLRGTIVLIVTRFLCYTGWLVYYFINHPEPPFWDFKWFYVASNLAHQNLSPFNVEVFTDSFCTLTNVCGSIPPFVYPPNIIPLIWFLGYFSIKNAFTIWTVLHLIAMGLLLWGANVLLESNSRAFRAICTISVALIYGVVRDLQVGNLAIFIAVLIVWMFIFAKKHQDIAAGILLGIAVCKPTLAVLFIPYFLLKRRFSLVVSCIVTAVVLALIGLAMTGVSLSEFFPDASRGFSLWIKDPSNSPYISMSRIDWKVIGPRVFPNHLFIARLFSDLIVLILVGLVSFYLYKKQKNTAWSKDLYLPEIALISCLSIGMNYSQKTSLVMLTPAVVFLLNDLLYQIRCCKFYWQRISIWLVGVSCLVVQTAVFHGWIILGFLGKQWNWKAGELPYIIKVTIYAIPSYAILGITISILLLAMTSIRQKKIVKFELLNQISH